MKDDVLECSSTFIITNIHDLRISDNKFTFNNVIHELFENLQDVSMELPAMTKGHVHNVVILNRGKNDKKVTGHVEVCWSMNGDRVLVYLAKSEIKSQMYGIP
jgi:hypothetical protein